MSMNDITPRLGASYDLFGNGKTALKASLGKYMLTLFTIGNPAGVSTTTTRNWNDLMYPVGDPRRGNFNPDCDQLNPAANGECSAYLSPFGTLTSIAQFNEDTRFGWGNRPTTGSSRRACSTSSRRASASTSATSAAGSATSR